METCSNKHKILAYFHDGPIYRDKEGHFYDYSLSPEILKPYFQTAEKVRLVIRVNEKDEKMQMKLLDTQGLSVCPIEDVKSLKGMGRYSGTFGNTIRKQVREADYNVVRLPSITGSLAARYARKLKKPYAAELVSAPGDIYRYHSLKGKIAAPFMDWLTKKTLKKAWGTIYVTEHFLQERYPVPGNTLACADVVLPTVKTAKNPEFYERRIQKKIFLGTAGSLDAAFKGQQYVVEALAKLKEQGNDRFLYRVAGPGTGEELLKLARKLGVEDQLEISGCLTGEALLAWYEELDLYVQPSLTEGLPRAVLEAMARGTAVIGSKIGGNEELLGRDALFAVGKRGVPDLCKLLLGLSPRRLSELSEAGVKKAALYQYDTILAARSGFYAEYQKETEGEKGASC